ncbi:MAG: thiamine phosphate synthase [Acidobacteriota bacterium]
MSTRGPSDGAAAPVEHPPTSTAPRSAAAPAPRIERAQVPRLYAIADGDALLGAAAGAAHRMSADPVGTVVEAVDAMAAAGVGWIQLRLKSLTDRERYRIGEAAARRLRGSGAPLWIDDREDLAAVLGADGVHVGQADLSPASVRSVVGDGVWIGLSCHGAEQVAAAERDPDVDVVAIGPVFTTRSKANPDPDVGLEGVRSARLATSKPLVAIGGIDADSAAGVLEAGADSVVMLGAICRGDVAARSRALVAAAGRAFHRDDARP